MYFFMIGYASWQSSSSFLSLLLLPLTTSACIVVSLLSLKRSSPLPSLAIVLLSDKFLSLLPFSLPLKGNSHSFQIWNKGGGHFPLRFRIKGENNFISETKWSSHFFQIGRLVAMETTASDSKGVEATNVDEGGGGQCHQREEDRE